jgi:hypothetical protein
MTTLWQWFTQRWMTHHRRTRAALLAHVQWQEQWMEPQAIHVPPQVDTLSSRLAEEVSVMLTAWV